MAKSKKGMGAGKAVAIGAGIAAASAAGFYFLGPKGKAHQKKAKTWMVKMEKEVGNKIKQAKEVTEPIYHNIVDGVVKPYIAKNVPNAKEIQAHAENLKKQWQDIVKSSIKNAKPKAKKIVKKAVKKTTAKAPKKVNNTAKKGTKK